MEYVIIGFLLSIGFGLAKILTDILSEIVFTRLHTLNRYKIICKREDASIKEPKKRKNYVIGFQSNDDEK